MARKTSTFLSRVLRLFGGDASRDSIDTLSPEGIELRVVSRRWYQALASKTFERRDVTFMNYGFANLIPGSARIPLSADEEKDRFAIQNYHYLVERVPLAGKEVLEVGSGRGGGAAYIMKTFRPQSLIGIDLSQAAVRFSREVHRHESLSFQVGDAEDILMPVESFDVVINLESSHCYASMERFLAGVFRVLKPGGDFLFTDLRWDRGPKLLFKQFRAAGFELLTSEDVSKNVFAALQDQSETRRRLELRALLDDEMNSAFDAFAGVPGTYTYRAFARGTAFYLRCHLRKPA